MKVPKKLANLIPVLRGIGKLAGGSSLCRKKRDKGLEKGVSRKGEGGGIGIFSRQITGLGLEDWRVLGARK